MHLWICVFAQIQKYKYKNSQIHKYRNTLNNWEYDFWTNNLSDKNIRGLYFWGPDLPGPDLLGRNLPGHNLPVPNFPGANLPGAQFAGAQFAGKECPGPNLQSTELILVMQLVLMGAFVFGTCSKSAALLNLSCPHIHSGQTSFCLYPQKRYLGVWMIIGKIYYNWE